MLARVSELPLKPITLLFTSMVMMFLLMITTQSYAEVYKTNQAFLNENFAGKVPAPKHVWLRDNLKKQASAILAHPYGKLRVKYWMSGNKSAWILEEIGKEKPITTGIIINTGQISKIEILAFRESRGWEVKYPFFLKQFINTSLKANKQLTRNVDGITGATLSVRAVTKLARLALLLHNHEKQK